MISLTELQYVNSWTRGLPYPGIEYSKESFKKLKAATQMYESNYRNRQYEISFSNGEQIFFEIQIKNLCHMLGVDYKNLTNEYFDEFRQDILRIENTVKLSSYDLLMALLEHQDDVLEYDLENGGKVLNYYRIRIKCDIFDKLSDFSKFDFGCIIFDDDTYTRTSSKNRLGNATKYFYLPSQESVCPYFMMGINKSETSEYYYVETLVAPTNSRDFFNDQVVVMPTQIVVTNEEAMHKYSASANEKIHLLNQYKELVQQFQIPNRIDIFGDYLATLAEEARTETKQKTLGRKLK